MPPDSLLTDKVLPAIDNNLDKMPTDKSETVLDKVPIDNPPIDKGIVLDNPPTDMSETALDNLPIDRV